MSTELLARAEELRVARTPFVLATVVRAERPTSAKAGDRAIVMADGTMEGFVGGVCSESTVRLEGLRLLGQPGAGESTLLRITPTDGETVSTTADVPEGLVVVGNPCLSGGTLDIFLEAVQPAALVHVFGESPIARALVTVARAAGYAVTATADAAAAIAPDTAAVVVASHGRDEETVLSAARAAGVPYVGLVASPRRGAAVMSAMDGADGTAGTDTVHTPAGLNIGARTPFEVAVSVLAELIAVGATRSAEDRAAAPQAPTPRRVAQLPLIPQQTTAPASSATAIDPVCGMTVAAVPATLHLEHDGKTWYFCAPGCRKAFAADPARYGA